jgi:septal ring factor EnvC (AmiA/AmiB activator)
MFMHTFTKFARFLLIGLMIAGTSAMVGCTKKPNNEDVSKLEEARTAAESAERKLSDLRQERVKLEQDLQSKQSELKSNEQEQDDLKNKVNE